MRCLSSFSITFFLYIISFNLQAQLSTVPIGGAGNLYTIINNEVNSISANEDLNTIVFIHRNDPTVFGGTTAEYRYDISTNGGFNWVNNIGILNPGSNNTTIAARYPNVTIHNPSGNSTPAAAHLGYMGTWHNGGLWNGIVSGTAQLNNLSTTFTETYATPNNSNTLIPVGLCKGAQGVYWAVDWDYDDTSLDSDGLIIYRGDWNNLTSDIDWVIDTFITLPFDKSVNGVATTSSLNIAFSPTGQYGWVCFASDLDVGGPEVHKLHLLHSDDFGASWSGPISLDLKSLDNLMAIVDTTVGTEPGLGFDADIGVDNNGNPHIATTVTTAATGYSIFGTVSPVNVYDITYNRQSPNCPWQAILVDNLRTFRGTFGAGVSNGGVSSVGIDEDNRPQVAVNNDGSKVFIGWLDSDPALTGGANDQPDFFMRALDINSKMMTQVVNFSGPDATWSGQALFASCSPNVLESGSTFTIPTVFTQMTNTDLDPVQFHYVQNINFNTFDFTIPFTLNSNFAIDVAGSALICDGDTVNLSASAFCTNGPATYNWTPTTGLNNPTIANPMAMPNQTTTYVVTVTDSSGASLSDSVTISVINCSGGTSAAIHLDHGQANLDNSLFIWPLNNNYDCSDTFTISYATMAYDSLHDATSQQGYSILPSTILFVDSIEYAYGHVNNSGQANTLITSVVSLNSAGVPTGNVLWADTISSTTSLSGGTSWTSVVTRRLYPAISLPAGTKFGIRIDYVGAESDSFGVIASYFDNCAGACAAEISPFNEPAYYDFNHWAACGPMPSQGIYLDCNSNSQNDPGQCENLYLQHFQISAWVNAFGLQAPSFSVQVSPGGTICNGISTVLSANGLNGVPPYSYSWSPATGLDNPNVSSPLASPTVTTTYTVTATDSTGATATEQVTIFVNPSPNGNAGPDQAICNVGGSVQLNATGGLQYIWTPTTGLSNPFIANPIASPTVTTTYLVTVIAQNGCSDIDTVVVSVFPSGLTPNIYVNGNIAWTDQYVTYQWQFNGNNISGATQQSFTAPIDGFYSVQVSDVNGCMGTSNVAFVSASATPSCNGPDSLWTISTDDTSAHLAWSYVPVVNSVVIRYRTSNPVGPWMMESVSPYLVPSHQLSGLNPGTSYDWEIAIVCGVDTSSWIGTASFATSGVGCAVVLATWVAPITPVSARLNWTAPPGAHHFEIRGRRVGTTNFINISIPAGSPNFKDVFGLSNGFDYEWEIKTYCDAAETLSSPWSGLMQFTSECQPPDSIWADPVTASGARLNWVPVIGAAGYEIRGRRVGTTGLATILVSNTQSFKDVFGLLSGFSYEWTMRSWCDPQGNKTSDFLPFSVFTTLNGTRMVGADAWNIDEPKLQINVWPNPTDEFFEIEIGGGISSEVAELSIVDATGRKLIDVEIASSGQSILDVSNLGNGFYHLFIKADGWSEHRKLLIQR